MAIEVSSIIIVFISVIMRLVIFLLLVLPLFGRVIHCLAMMYPYTISRYEITIYSRKAAISTPPPPFPQVNILPTTEQVHYMALIEPY